MILKTLRKIFLQLFSGEKKHYLVLLQNSNELRSTGGYITHVADITVGRYALNIRFLSVNEDLIHDEIIGPPEAMKRLLKVKTVQLRDGNYNPDFSKTGELIAKLYNKTYQEFDVGGVMAINYQIIEDLLRLSGEITYDGKIINSSSLFYYLSTTVSNIDLHNKKALENRKGIIKNIWKMIIKKSIFQWWKWLSLKKLIADGIAAKDIQVWLKERGEEKNTSFSFAGYRDSLSVIDNNYLGIKSNRYIRRVISRDININDKGKISARVQIELMHAGGYSYPLSGTYQSHLSIYIPPDAENIRIKESKISNQENHKEYTILGFDNLLPPGEKTTIIIEYELSAKKETESKNNTYTFKYIAQSGVREEIIMETIKYPEYFTISSENKDLTIRDHVAFMQGSSKDYTYVIETKVRDDGPRIFFHEITGPQRIEVRFHEPIAQIKPENIKVIKKGGNEEIKVHSTEIAKNGRILFIQTENLPETPEQFYEVTLKNIENLRGKTPSLNPRTLTVVYRPKLFY